LRDAGRQVQPQERPEAPFRPQRDIREAGDGAERRHDAAPLTEPVGEDADQRRRDDFGPDPGGEQQGDLLRVETAAGEPHRPERQLDADDKKARRVERAEARADGSPMLRHRRYTHLVGLDAAAIRTYVAGVLPGLNEASALLSVVIIDVVLAGDNAIIVGMAAAGLPPERRRRVILLGIAAATVLRILFAFVALELLQTVIGMTAAGGLLLLWVAWKMYREIRAADPVPAHASAAASPPRRRREKTTAQAMTQIVLADLSMSLDNVLAVAGVARDHPYVLAIGLVLSVALMGVASTYVARLLDRLFWLAWVGLGIITFVALRMIWDGSAQIIHHAAMLNLFG
jgi:YjbE family integral membrane protein